MGNVERQTEKIRFLVTQIKNEIPRGTFFELGDDQRKLEKIDRQLQKLYQSLNSLSDHYTLRPLSESNPYLQAVRFAEETQEFIRSIQDNKTGSIQNTSHFLELMSKVETSISMFASEQDLFITSNTTTIQRKRGQKASVPIRQIDATPATKITVLDEPALVATSPTKKKPIVVKILGFIFIFFPRILGQAILDLGGREQAASTTAILLGYALITTVVLIIWGFWDLDKIVSLVKELRGSE